MSALSFREWSPSLHRAPRRWSPYVVLRAWFDESGIHKGAEATLLTGFVGTAEAFDAAEAAWQAVLDSEEIPYFHYTAWLFSNPPFEKMTADQCGRLLPKLAQVIADATPGIRIVSVAYDGVWDPSISAEQDGISRFRNPYQFLFEFLMEALNGWSERDLGGERIVPVLAHQQQYGPPAESLYGLVAPTDSWPLAGPLAFDEPKDRQALQMADMLAYELFQFMKRKTSDQLNRPLLSRIWANDEMASRNVLFNVTHNEHTLRRLIARGPVAWGPGYAGTMISDEEIRANTEEAKRLRDSEGDA